MLILINLLGAKLSSVNTQKGNCKHTFKHYNKKMAFSVCLFYKYWIWCAGGLFIPGITILYNYSCIPDAQRSTNNTVGRHPPCRHLGGKWSTNLLEGDWRAQCICFPWSRAAAWSWSVRPIHGAQWKAKLQAAAEWTCAGLTMLASHRSTLFLFGRSRSLTHLLFF